jgi:hypothetical protein
MEKKMTDLQHSTREESNARCNVCSMGLSWVENYLYGNRCVLCAGTKQRMGLWRLIALVVMDWLIYRKILSFSAHPDAKMTVIGSLGEIGYFDLNQIRSITEKVKFLRILHQCAKHLT